MYITNELGVESTSEMFFYSTTPAGMDLFYYPICAGHYYCKENYFVNRKQHYSIYIMLILKGKCYIETEFTTETAKQGDAVIIDCWLPHKYKAVGNNLETMWVHIDGGNCRDLCKEIVKHNGNILRSNFTDKVNAQVESIYNILAKKKNCPEAILSSYIYSLLCNCFTPQYNFKKTIEKKEPNSISAEAKSYIFNNLDSKITVKNLSDCVHLSPSQFSKIFKEQTGYSPYDFVLVTRTTKAKELLLETDMSISEIALEIGFQSDCNFTTFFTTGTGMSPSKFRKEHKCLNQNNHGAVTK